MGRATVDVAPREIIDAVDRASRVHGCAVSDAHRVAADVCYCEIHHGRGLAAWIRLVDDEPGRLAAAVCAARELDRAAVELSQGEPAVVHWAPPIPGALVFRTVAAIAGRGVAAGPCDDADGATLFEQLELVAAEPITEPAQTAARSADALTHGITVDRDDWRRVEREARGFLTPSADLDAADEKGPRPCP
ncbi:MAG: hypothetical protein HKN44_10545 [Ilumatobacter sp.]|nr:hypothetical protein [Ilumatobacter sp.]